VANGDTSDASDINGPLQDLETDMNTPRPVVAGGTGASTAATARANLGLTIGTNVQAYDAGLQSIAGLTTAADKMIYTTASDTYAVTDLTAAGRALLDDANAAAQRTTLGLAIGTDVQAYNANLASLSGITLQEGDLLYATGANTLVRLAKGTASQILRMNAGATAPEWAAPASSSGGITLLGTINTTSGGSQSLSGLDLTSYKFLKLVFQGVSGSTTGNIQVAGQNVFVTPSASGTYRGIVTIDLGSGVYSAVLADAAANNSATASPVAGDTSLSTASTSVSVSVTSGAFDGGSVTVYGMA
jgi:hypothetical protein